MSHGLIKKWSTAMLDFVYPPRCHICGEWERQLRETICARCRSGFELIGHPMCPRCGLPFESSPYDHECGECAVKAPVYEKQRSSGFYEGALREAILGFKFNGRTGLTAALGSMVVRTFQEEFSAEDIDSIMPVPLHPRRLRWRGFNQSLLIARKLGEHMGIWVDAHSLRRLRDTTPQVRLTPRQRALNVRGAFGVTRSRFVDGRRILVVDDVVTTGSTLRECARVLLRHGADKVFVLTVARAK